VGVHRTWPASQERRYTYVFAAIGAPLFAAASCSHTCGQQSCTCSSARPGLNVFVSLDGYFGFVTKMMLLFGVAFEFPLLIAMLNAVGMVSGKRLLGWWRPPYS